MKIWVDRLKQEHTLPPEGYKALLTCTHVDVTTYLHRQAQKVTQARFGNNIYIRGLIEISNCCRNNCYYCGIRKGNPHVARYRLSPESILDCCKQGYALGFRTFVLQGGEDPALTDDRIETIVATIRRHYPDCAITLSLGEKSREAYERSFTLEPIATCYGTKLTTRRITANCTLPECPASNACNACKT